MATVSGYYSAFSCILQKRFTFALKALGGVGIFPIEKKGSQPFTRGNTERFWPAVLATVHPIPGSGYSLFMDLGEEDLFRNCRIDMYRQYGPCAGKDPRVICRNLWQGNGGCLVTYSFSEQLLFVFPACRMQDTDGAPLFYPICISGQQQIPTSSATGRVR